MSPEDKRKIVMSGEATATLNNMGIETTGDNRTAIDILGEEYPELAKSLALRVEALLSIEG